MPSVCQHEYQVRLHLFWQNGAHCWRASLRVWSSAGVSWARHVADMIVLVPRQAGAADGSNVSDVHNLFMPDTLPCHHQASHNTCMQHDGLRELGQVFQMHGRPGRGLHTRAEWCHTQREGCADLTALFAKCHGDLRQGMLQGLTAHGINQDNIRTHRSSDLERRP